MSVQTINPATGQPLAIHPETFLTISTRILDPRTRGASSVAADGAGGARAGVRRLAGALRDRREELAVMATREMGKPAGLQRPWPSAWDVASGTRSPLASSRR
jgi:acyl-CoA reductase-like NAD-dependent aldehyde dehydrogenase